MHLQEAFTLKKKNSKKEYRKNTNGIYAAAFLIVSHSEKV